MTSGLLVPSASADQISDLKAQAASIASRIDALGQQEEALSERYDAAQLQVATLQARVAQASQELAAAQAKVDQARQVLKQDAVQAYVDGGENQLSSSSPGGPIQNANTSLLRAEYVNTLATDQTEAIDQYHVATLQEQAATSNYKQQEQAAQVQLALVKADENQVAGVAAQLTSTEHQVNGQIATLVAQQQAAAAAAAAQAAAARLAQERAAAAAAAAAQLSAAQTPASSATVGPPPPVGSGAAGAVRAAESRLGDWYQWGATGPNTFDCSGLVMWAYEQVGISLPHYSGAQYSDTTHIPMSDLQPGDLVFFSDPGEHVAMYIGNGEIIEAPHTGAQVHITALYPEFTLASRVE